MSRAFLKKIRFSAGVTAFLFLSFLFYPLPAGSAPARLSDEALLDKIQRQSFEYFVKERNDQNGLVRDRAPNFGAAPSNSPASIAATGFALAAYPIAVSRKWMSYASAKELTRRTMDFFLNHAEQEHGFFYHFLKMDTGLRSGQSELSPIDTVLLVAGMLFAAEYYDDPQLRFMTRQIYERVDWQWMMHGKETMAMSWSPETGFSRNTWDRYCELLILYLMAIGSPTHPISAESWHAFLRPVGSYGGYKLIQSPPLFTHQYSHIFIDFRNIHDDYADYFKNSVSATLANRAFCINQAKRSKSYGPNSWGITASDGPPGYKAYGAPPGWAEHDGTIAPTGCGSSIPFTPKESLACLRHFYEDPEMKLWGRYGFADAFNKDKNWIADDAIGIDQGALLLMIENYRTGMIWKYMKRNPDLRKAMRAVGFQPGSRSVDFPNPPAHHAPYIAGGMTVDGFFRDWPNMPALRIDKTMRESGTFETEKDLDAEIRFAWDESALYFALAVKDDSLVLKNKGRHIWQDDLLELYIDPQGDGLYWFQKEDYQIGFKPGDNGQSSIWSWFQGGEDLSLSGSVAARSFIDQSGYWIEGAVSWSFLEIRPKAGDVLRISPAIHDADRDRSSGKAQWFFRNEDGFQRFVLGKLILDKKASPRPDKKKV